MNMPASAMLDLLQISVYSMGGDYKGLLQMPQEATVSSLKKVIADKWQIPILCQKLLVDSLILDDNDKLVKCCIDGSANAAVNLVVSLDEACKSLDSPVWETCHSAALALSQMDQQNKTCIVAAIASHLKPVKPARAMLQ